MYSNKIVDHTKKKLFITILILFLLVQILYVKYMKLEWCKIHLHYESMNLCLNVITKQKVFETQ